MTSKKISEENGEKRCHVKDIETLNRTELHRKYPVEYDSWKNRKGAAKKKGNWSAEFDDFGDFLRRMGPIPEKGMTLDRIDPRNPRYAPGLCRWATKQQQANNRTSTRTVSIDGVMTPLSDVARAIGQDPVNVRQRGYNGWAEIDALTGIRNGVTAYFGKDPRTYRPWPKAGDLPEKWEQEWRRSGVPGPGNSRFEYLITNLKIGLVESNERLWRMHETDSEYPNSEVAQRELAHNKKLQNALEEAEELFPQWADAVVQFEAQRREEETLRSLKYRSYRRRDEES